MKTPYQVHSEANHQVTRHSPNGYITIEECSECPAKFLLSPSIGHPVTIHPPVKSMWHLSDVPKA